MTDTAATDERIATWLREKRQAGEHQFFTPGIIASALNLPKGGSYNDTPRVRCMRLHEQGILEAKYVSYDVWAYRYDAKQAYREESSRR